MTCGEANGRCERLKQGKISDRMGEEEGIFEMTEDLGVRLRMGGKWRKVENAETVIGQWCVQGSCKL